MSGALTSLQCLDCELIGRQNEDTGTEPTLQQQVDPVVNHVSYFIRVRDVGCTIYLLRVALETTCFLFKLGCALAWVLLLIFCSAIVGYKG